MVRDPDTGVTSAWLSIHSDIWDGAEYSYSDERRIIPDLSLYSPEDPDSWISPSDLETSAGMSPGSIDWPTATSGDGSRVLCADWSAGTYREFDRMGNPLWEAPPMNADGQSCDWSHINGRGDVACLKTRWVPASGSVPAHHRHAVQYWNGGAVTTTDTPGDWYAADIQNHYVYINGMDNEGRLLLWRYCRGTTGAYVYEYHVFDAASGTFTRVPTPGTGCWSQTMSISGGRIAGSGAKPFMVTPGGTCVKLAALRVRNTPADPETTLGAIFPNNLNPVHITSSGIITATANNSSGYQIVLQIIPNNDLDNDGIPDDWEKHWAAVLLASGDAYSVEKIAQLTAGNLIPEFDYTGDGFTATMIFASAKKKRATTGIVTGAVSQQRVEWEFKSFRGLGAVIAQTTPDAREVILGGFRQNEDSWTNWEDLFRNPTSEAGSGKFARNSLGD